VYPDDATGVKVNTVPAAYVPPDGFTVPAPSGLTDVVSVYCDGCVVSVAESVAAAAVMLCEIAPPSLHETNEYVFAPYVCGEATPTVCEDPGVHTFAHGVLHDTPSTITAGPAGTVVMIIVTVGLE